MKKNIIYEPYTTLEEQHEEELKIANEFEKTYTDEVKLIEEISDSANKINKVESRLKERLISFNN